nr:LRR receptor-like serine/threonine-protein kinase GSO1 [Ipomoea batatas]
MPPSCGSSYPLTTVERRKADAEADEGCRCSARHGWPSTTKPAAKSRWRTLPCTNGKRNGDESATAFTPRRRRTHRWKENREKKRTSETGYAWLLPWRSPATIPSSQSKKRERRGDESFPSSLRSLIGELAILHGKKKITGDDNLEMSDDIDEITSFSSGVVQLDVENEIDEVHAVRDDHHEGIWEI